MTLNWKSLIYIAAVVAVIALFSQMLFATRGPVEITLDEVIAMSQANEINEMMIDHDVLYVFRSDGTELKSTIGYLNYIDLQELGLNLSGVDYKISPSGFEWGSLLISFLPLIFIGGLLFFMFRRAQGANRQAMSFGRSRARLFPANTPTVTFDDVAGIEEAKQEVHEVVDFLKSREKFQRLGARIPKGMLLIGPPGTGKTLLARAIAGEAGVPFFSISGSEFVEMFVGVGASRVRDLFEQAKRNTPCIIFIDEIDAVGRHRGAGLGGGHDEREQTLNQILVEMDGFDTNTSVIILAATNRPDILDPALLRPGRFDRRIILDRPDINGRNAILKIHTNGKPLDKSVSLDVVARQTAGFSGADLANLVNEAAILAARRDQEAIMMLELEESIDRVLAGPEKKSRRISPEEKAVTAYHEAGHALVGKLLPNIEPLRKVTIIPRGMTGGHTRFLEEDRGLYTLQQFRDRLGMMLGGRMAEELIFNEISTGSANDIKTATDLARKMVTDFGMSEKLGPRTFGDKQELVFLGREISEQKNYGDKVADTIDEEVSSIIREAQDVARRILLENRPILERIAKGLMARETLEGEDLEALFKDSDSTVEVEAKDPVIPVETEKPVLDVKPKPAVKKNRMPPDLNPHQAPASS
ncbi:ATP-dependent zinc metalloprotease FtsH [Chloroflexota bacterium]